MSILSDTIAAIKPVNEELRPAIQAHLDDLTKPQGSLGRLEAVAMQYCLASDAVMPAVGKKRIVCFAGDHGVAEEGVSAYPPEVTPQMVMNMLAGGAAINAFTRHAEIDLTVVDIGVADPLTDAPGLCRRKVRPGTANMAKGPAMSPEEAQQALEVGIALAGAAAEDGITLLGTGDMGIANTTPSTALFAAFLGVPVADITGRGTGVDDTALQRKIHIVEKALEVNRAACTGPLDTLAALGGLEIAGICGLILGAAAHHIPVVVDGFISSAAAITACQFSEAAGGYLFFSHLSQEKGHRSVLQKTGYAPLLELDMRLGEGTGAALAIPIVEAAMRAYTEMATFSSAGVSGKD